jgi:hypothetical protein
MGYSARERYVIVVSGTTASGQAQLNSKYVWSVLQVEVESGELIMREWRGEQTF